VKVKRPIKVDHYAPGHRAACGVRAARTGWMAVTTLTAAARCLAAGTLCERCKPTVEKWLKKEIQKGA